MSGTSDKIRINNERKKIKKLLSIFTNIGLLASLTPSMVDWHTEIKNPVNQLNIDILIEDINSNEITSFNEQTNLGTLGELMFEYQNNYRLKDFGEPWGLYYVVDGKEFFSDVGMSRFVFI